MTKSRWKEAGLYPRLHGPLALMNTSTGTGADEGWLIAGGLAVAAVGLTTLALLGWTADRRTPTPGHTDPGADFDAPETSDEPPGPRSTDGDHAAH